MENSLLLGQQTKTPRFSLLVTNWLFFALAVFVVSFFLLTDVSECGSISFCSTTIFILVLFISLFMLLFLWLISSRVRLRLQGKNNVLLFFLSPASLRDLLWIPIGYVTVLGISFATGQSNYEYAPHIGIFVSGLVMLVAFLQTNSIIVPILIHGFYNSTVVLLREGIGLASIPVPKVGIDIPIAFFGDLVTEAFFQIILVASAEELFKVFGIAFFVVATAGRFQSKGYIVWLGGIFSVFIWMTMHTIISI